MCAGDMRKDSSMSCTLLQLGNNNKSTAVTTVPVAIVRQQLAGGSTSVRAVPMPAKRVCLGGRGREWVSECLKLLKIMSELSDAKIFLEPVDPVKYPDYYVMVNEPLDLSKVLLKFHGGSYHSLIEFTKDMRFMFDNYKNFFRDSKIELFQQIRYVASWFESEIEKINSRWYRLCMTGLTSASVPTARTYTPRTGSLEAKIQAIEADNQRILSMSGLGMQAHTPPAFTFPKVKPIRPRMPSSLYTIRVIGNSNAATSSPSVSVSFGQSQPSTGNILRPLTSVAVSAPSIILPNSVSAASSSVFVCNSSGVVRAKVQPSTLKPILASAKLVLVLEVSNIWFGATRCKPCRPIVISEQGIKLILNDNDANVEFNISSEEIVRCAAYFGNARKHTLFVFVVPNCTRRLPPSLGDHQTLSTLIVIFLPALSARQIADLVYLFWRMGRTNIFSASSGLLTEVDQKGALSLLSNIKPTIFSTVIERVRDIASADPVTGVPRHDHTEEVDDCALDDVPNVGLECNVNGDEYVSEREDNKNGILNDVNNTTGDKAVTTRCSKGSKRKSCFSSYLSDDDDSDPFDDDPSEDYSPSRSGLRIKLASSVRRSLGSKRRRKRSSQNEEETQIDIVDLPTGVDLLPSHILNNNDDDDDSDGLVCKTEVVDDKYNQHEQILAAAAEADGEEPFDLSEQYTILQQWEPDTVTPSGEDGDEDDAGSALQSVEEDGESVSNIDNDLEIVQPAIESDEDDVDIDANATSLNSIAENDDDDDDINDLVMVREKLTLRCPITQQIMRQPMKNTRCGHCYDKKGVENVIKHRGRKAKCPVPGCSNEVPLNMNDLINEYNLLQHIQTRTPSGDGACNN